jgi:hypothetical protein
MGLAARQTQGFVHHSWGIEGITLLCQRKQHHGSGAGTAGVRSENCRPPLLKTGSWAVVNRDEGHSLAVGGRSESQPVDVLSAIS